MTRKKKTRTPANNRRQRSHTNYIKLAIANGMPEDQIRNFISAGYFPQPKQMLFHAAARAADSEEGPDQIGFGGARGGGKSHTSFAQLALDDCRRYPNVKGLYIRKVGKQAREQFDDLRRTVIRQLGHHYNKQEGVLHMWNGARIFIGSFRHEGEIDNYLGLEYDFILIEETTSLTKNKYQALRDSNRTSKPGVRPRIYNTTNPGNIGHAWYKRLFIDPNTKQEETETKFIPARVYDNEYIDKGYRRKLEQNSGWRRRAYLEGDWNIAAGQYFTEFREETHIVDNFEIPSHWQWYLSMDYGWTHHTVFILRAHDTDGNIYAVDEHVGNKMQPSEHAIKVKEMVKRRRAPQSVLQYCIAGGDVFQHKGRQTVAEEYDDEGIHLVTADMDRIQGAASVYLQLGSPHREPSLFFFRRCHRLIECIPMIQHDPKKPEDTLKVDMDDDGFGGDDEYDALRYGIMDAYKSMESGGRIEPAESVVQKAKRRRRTRL